MKFVVSAILPKKLADKGSEWLVKHLEVKGGRIVKIRTNQPFVLASGDSRSVLKQCGSNVFDSCVTDPPYELGFMGKSWDRTGVANDVSLWAEVLRTLKPGAHLLAFGGTRTYHRMTCAIEDAGFEIRDCIMWVYGCLSDDTEVLTREGWKTVYEAQGSEIAIYDVQNDIYQWETPERWTIYQSDGDPAFRIHSPETDQIVSANHRCLVDTNGSLTFVEASLLSSMESVPTLPSGVSLLQEGSETQKVRTWPSYRSSMATVEQIQYTGTFFCPTVSTGAFIARRNGMVFLTGNSGFPKSLDVSKAIDGHLKHGGSSSKQIKATNLSRPGKVTSQRSINSHNGLVGTNKRTVSIKRDTPDTEEAARWHGWGTALKPAVEPIVVARKPIEGTVATNVLKHSIGGLNIDGCRVPLDGDYKSKANGRPSQTGLGDKYDPKQANKQDTKGRWPANLIHDGSEEVLAKFPEANSSRANGNPNNPKRGSNHTATSFGQGDDKETNDYRDGGSAARFFYCAKTSRADRNAGLDDPGPQFKHGATMRRIENTKTVGNTHPTVKPTDLMRHLCQLVAPPGALILDPFRGSGSTGRGALLSQQHFFGIDLDEHHDTLSVSRARILDAVQPRGLFDRHPETVLIQLMVLSDRPLFRPLIHLSSKAAKIAGWPSVRAFFCRAIQQ